MPPMTTAMILMCAMSTPPDKCTAQTAIYRTEIALQCSTDYPQYRPMASLPQQSTLHDKNWAYYYKTTCAAK